MQRRAFVEASTGIAAAGGLALLNTGEPVECAVDMVPSDHAEQKGYLRLRKLPVNELANTVLVVKLEFDELPAALFDPNRPGGGSDILSC